MKTIEKMERCEHALEAIAKIYRTIHGHVSSEIFYKIDESLTVIREELLIIRATSNEQ